MTEVYSFPEVQRIYRCADHSDLFSYFDTSFLLYPLSFPVYLLCFFVSKYSCGSELIQGTAFHEVIISHYGKHQSAIKKITICSKENADLRYTDSIGTLIVYPAILSLISSSNVVSFR